MIKDIPVFIYDKDGLKVRVVKTSKIYFRKRQVYGYIFHIEKAERVTTITEFDLENKEGKYYIKRDVFKDCVE